MFIIMKRKREEIIKKTYLELKSTQSLCVWFQFSPVCDVLLCI